jgi:uncharacterized protein YecE (DUF72 family)
VGTSGFSYDEWRGSFYPRELRPEQRLAYYSERLDCVEINNTFYRMPQEGLLAKWQPQVPPDFVFVLKAPRRITHTKKLSAESGDDVRHLEQVSRALGTQRGPFLFQMPPTFKKDVAVLREFLGLLPAQPGAAFEFRHESWNDPEVRALLGERNAALCIADTDEAAEPELFATGRFGYLRLRRADYDAAALERWAQAVLRQPWERAFVFFKHEDEGRGPALAQQFRQALRSLGHEA